MSNRRWEIVKQLFEVHSDFAMTYYDSCLCFLQSISGWFVLYIIKSGLKSTLSFITEVCPEYICLRFISAWFSVEQMKV